MAEIEFRDVTKRYPDGFEAVAHLTLDVADGELMILVGPSGSGKSTALRMVAGLEDVSDGEILIANENATAKAPRDRDVAMVFQNYALYPHMTVRENMGFALKLAKVPAREIEKKVLTAAESLDLVSQLDRKPANLSGGQRQRVAMGRAIVRNPSAFLLDEPLSNLDAKLRVQTRVEIARIQKRLGTTMLYVTHDQTEALTLGDRIAVLRGGELQQAGTPADLYERPENLFVAGFIGSPAMNFMFGDLQGDLLRLPLGDVPLDVQLRARIASAAGRLNDRVIVGIRPEHLEDATSSQGASSRIEFKADIDMLESVGSDAYAYFRIPAERVSRSELDELAADSGASRPDGGNELVARLNGETKVVGGGRADLWFDARHLHLFDPESGAALRSEEE